MMREWGVTPEYVDANWTEELEIKLWEARNEYMRKSAAATDRDYERSTEDAEPDEDGPIFPDSKSRRVSPDFLLKKMRINPNQHDKKVN